MRVYGFALVGALAGALYARARYRADVRAMDAIIRKLYADASRALGQPSAFK